MYPHSKCSPIICGNYSHHTLSTLAFCPLIPGVTVSCSYPFHFDSLPFYPSVVDCETVLAISPLVLSPLFSGGTVNCFLPILSYMAFCTHIPGIMKCLPFLPFHLGSWPSFPSGQVFSNLVSCLHVSSHLSLQTSILESLAARS